MRTRSSKQNVDSRVRDINGNFINERDLVIPLVKSYPDLNHPFNDLGFLVDVSHDLPGSFSQQQIEDALGLAKRVCRIERHGLSFILVDAESGKRVVDLDYLYSKTINDFEFYEVLVVDNDKGRKANEALLEKTGEDNTIMLHLSQENKEKLQSEADAHDMPLELYIQVKLGIVHFDVNFWYDDKNTSSFRITPLID